MLESMNKLREYMKYKEEAKYNCHLNYTLIFVALLSIVRFSAQDTFSIVAVDSITGEVGSAGASCVDLFQFGLPNDDFIGQLIPGVGAINTQAWYIYENQNNATNQMNAGSTPDEIIAWLIANDVQNQPERRQYGIVSYNNGSPESGGFTGSLTNDYKNHILGPNYAIQGNILLGQGVLDGMESAFLNETGNLACKLMAALQGANIVGADTRCAPNGTSSLFAYVKVAQPNDVFGSPSFLVSVRTMSNSGIEPIDSLQIQFDMLESCDNASLIEVALDKTVIISPNPASDYILVECDTQKCNDIDYQLRGVNGDLIFDGKLQSDSKIDLKILKPGIYVLKVKVDEFWRTEKIIKQ